MAIRVVLCLITTIAATAVYSSHRLQGEEVTQRNLERAVFISIPEAAYDEQILLAALAKCKSDASVATLVNKIDAQRLSHIKKSRIEWIQRQLPGLEREYEQEKERLRQAGIDPARSVGQFPLLSIYARVPLPAEWALDSECDLRTVTLESARYELSQTAQQAQGSIESLFANLVCQPIWDEIDLKGGFRELQGADPEIKLDVLRRAVWLHVSKVGNEETLERALTQIATDHGDSDWIRAKTPQLRAQFRHLKTLRKDWLSSVIKALEQPGSMREFQLPKDVWVAGQNVRLQGRVYLSPDDLPRLRLERIALETNVTTNSTQQLRDAIVSELSRQIVVAAKESSAAVTRLRGVNTAYPNGDQDRTGRDIFSWTISLDGCDKRLAQVDHVVYRLHPTFQPNVFEVKRKSIDDDKFPFTATGWGKFLVKIDVVFRDGSAEKVEHWLQW